MIPSLNFTFLVILIAAFSSSSSLSAKAKTKSGIIDFNENYDYAQLPSQTYGSVAPDYGYGSLDYPPYNAYQSEYEAPYGSAPALGGLYGATLGAPLPLRAQYGAPLGAPYGASLGAQYGSPLGPQYGAPLAAPYGTKYTAPLAAHYATPYGSQYGVTAGLAPLSTDGYKYSRRLTW